MYVLMYLIYGQCMQVAEIRHCEIVMALLCQLVGLGLRSEAPPLNASSRVLKTTPLRTNKLRIMLSYERLWRFPFWVIRLSTMLLLQLEWIW